MTGEHAALIGHGALHAQQVFVACKSIEGGVRRETAFFIVYVVVVLALLILLLVHRIHRMLSV